MGSRIPVEQLIDGVIRTLTGSVLPELTGSFGRGQLYAAVDVLQNLRDRVEPKLEPMLEEVESLRTTLTRLRETVREAAGDHSKFVGPLESLPEGTPTEQLEPLRKVFGGALIALDTLPESLAGTARAIAAEHLAAQTIRDVLRLKPSMLREISEGS